MNTVFYIWAAAGLLLMLSELIVPSFFIIFFGMGALVVALICLFVEPSLNIQLLVFSISSVGMLLLLRKWLKNVFTGFTAGRQAAGTKLTDNIGKTVKVISAISKGQPGKVELNGSDWRAESDDTLAPEELAVVVEQKNLTVKVEKRT